MAEKSSSASKSLLKNHIIHANSHNKIVEESVMWKQYENMKREESVLNSPETGYKRKRPFQPSRPRGSFNDTTTFDGRCSNEVNKPSFYWTQQLQKTEAAMEDRWDHNGYKEMHPEEFQSGSETEISHKNNKRKHKSKRKKHRVRNCNSDSECDKKKSKKCKYSTKLNERTDEKPEQSYEIKRRKEAIPDRWDHSGYREMHGDEFRNRPDVDKSCERKKHKLKKRKHKLEKMENSDFSEQEYDKKKSKKSKSRTKSQERKSEKRKRRDSRKH